MDIRNTLAEVWDLSRDMTFLDKAKTLGETAIFTTIFAVLGEQSHSFQENALTLTDRAKERSTRDLIRHTFTH